MKITDIELTAVHAGHRSDWIFLKLISDEGNEGIGELKPGQNWRDRVRAVTKLSAGLIGLRPDACAGLLARELDKAAGSATVVAAVSSLDQAVWDLRGKIADRPAFELLGDSVSEASPSAADSSRRGVAVYANINRAGIERTPGEFAHNAAAAAGEGFNAIKLAPFDGHPYKIDSTAGAADGILAVRAVRDAVGPDVAIMVDCHEHFTARGALEVADRFVEFGVSWFEQPVPEEDRDACREVKSRCPITVAGGEDLFPGNAFDAFLDSGTVDVVMPDVTVMGGVGQLRSVADKAWKFGIQTAPHGPFSPIALMAGGHAIAGCPGFRIIEYAWGEVAWRKELTIPNEDIVDGVLRLPEGAGFGVRLNPEILKRYRVCL